eukprot:763370-Hanusia_phi.AAC.1
MTVVRTGSLYRPSPHPPPECCSVWFPARLQRPGPPSLPPRAADSDPAPEAPGYRPGPSTH